MPLGLAGPFLTYAMVKIIKSSFIAVIALYIVYVFVRRKWEDRKRKKRER